MSTRVASSDQIADGAVASHALVKTEIPTSLNGRARLLWELAHGARSVVGEAPYPDVENPQGRPGIDLSGPPYGAALLIPVWTWAGRGDGTAQSGAPLRAIGGVEEGVYSARIFNRFHVPRVDGNAPLQRLRFDWRALASSSSSSNFELAITNRTTASRTVLLRNFASTATIPNREDANLIPFAPGFNDVDVTFRRTTGTATLAILSMMFVVVAKRRHGLTFPG